MLRSIKRIRVWTREFRKIRQRGINYDGVILIGAAIAIGLAAGFLSIGFREGVGSVQYLVYGFFDEDNWRLFAKLPWYLILFGPAVGGLIVGFYLKRFLPGGRPVGVAQVMEASALKGGRMSFRDGMHGAVANVTSLSFGASAGREGPVVHLGATVGAWVSSKLGLQPGGSRVLLACGVAASVAAAFNAPLAGVFFALEVVIGHYAVGALAPIVAASVVATAVTRSVYGAYPAFQLSPYALGSHWEFPAFALLGFVAALAAIAFMRSIPVVEQTHSKLGIPQHWRPAVGGLLVGAIALAFPQVLGVGYGATSSALRIEFAFPFLIGLAFAKTAATAITLGSGFGGGVFSPALFLGAVIGGAFGHVAGEIAPGVLAPAEDIFAGEGAYALVGMGAFAAAILGAPISTILMVFEITTDYALTTAVMLAVVAAVATVGSLHGAAYFKGQLQRRGIDMTLARIEADLLRDIAVGGIVSEEFARTTPGTCLREVRIQLQTAPFGELFVIDADDALIGTITLADLSPEAFDPNLDDLIVARDVARLHPPMLEGTDNLQDALGLMQSGHEEHMPVVDDRDGGRRIIGVLHERDVMLAYNQELVRLHRDESASF